MEIVSERRTASFLGFFHSIRNAKVEFSTPFHLGNGICMVLNGFFGPVSPINGIYTVLIIL